MPSVVWNSSLQERALITIIVQVLYVAFFAVIVMALKARLRTSSSEPDAGWNSKTISDKSSNTGFTTEKIELACYTQLT